MPATQPSRLLKAHDARNIGSKVAFNYEDLRQRCDQYIEQISAQAKQILLDARAEADQLRAEAQEQGHAQGLAAGHEEGLKDQQKAIADKADELSTERLNAALPTIQAAVDALNTERNRWLTTWQNTAIQLSVAIAEKLLHAELKQRPELVQESVREALELAAGNPQIKLRLNPDDADHLGDWCDELVATVSTAGTAEVVADPHVTPGGCVVDTKHGQVDARIETKLARIAQELLDDSV
jgi:flagellar assembly protein FliH